MQATLNRPDLVYPELSYRIVGTLFDVYNQLGPGFDESTYQRAVSLAFKAADIVFEEQVYAVVEYKGEKVGRKYFDFLIDKRIVLEIKRGDRFSKTHMDQVISYLKTNHLKLGILAYFGPRKLSYKRLVNL